MSKGNGSDYKFSWHVVLYPTLFYANTCDMGPFVEEIKAGLLRTALAEYFTHNFVDHGVYRQHGTLRIANTCKALDPASRKVNVSPKPPDDELPYRWLVNDVRCYSKARKLHTLDLAILSHALPRQDFARDELSQVVDYD